jgi:hypothetical protein
MVRILGILSGIIVGWYARDVGIDIVYWALIWAVVLTIGNLVIALREWKKDPSGVLMEALSTSNPSERELLTQQAYAARIHGWPFIQTIWRYNRVCFLLNAATIGVVAFVTYMITSFLR